MNKEIQNISAEAIIKKLPDLKNITCPVPFTLNNNIGLHIGDIKRIYKGFTLTPIFKNSNLSGYEARDQDGNTIILNFENGICSESYLSINENEENI